MRDDRLHDFGETDDKKKTIRINVKKSKQYGKEHDNKATKGGALANTIQHEILHAKRVGAKQNTEKKVWADTPRVLARMSKHQKNKLYGLLK